MQQIFGYIERITYQSPENGYTVAQLKDGSRLDLICIVGIMPSIQPGETVRCFGEWKNHLIHGKQFEVSQFKIEAPADIIGIKKYLGSGLIKGIGPAYAGRIVEKFGIETLNIIESSPERLLEIPRLGKKRMHLIKSCWAEQRSIRDVMIFLQSNGVTPTYAQKIYKVYGDQSIKKVKENPYQLARDIFGIGFKTADHIAEKLGILRDSTQRIEAGIEYVLSELSGDGHVCYPIDEFIKEAESVLEVGSAGVESRLTFLNEENRVELFEIVHEGTLTPFVWIKPLFLSETGIAREIRRLKNSQCNLRAIDNQKALAWVQDFLKIQLANNQKKAVVTALEEKIQIITGGPGTGKSTITNAILTITGKLTQNIVLAAPTGRAAKRMSEITGKKALTIHSLLEFDTKKWCFKKNRENPLECDLIIVDEASMIDTLLMYSLLKAIPNCARVIFVGDINQLPSVGPGNVLKDMISSKSIPVTMLNEIFRQATGSRIITNAHRINNGIFPDISNQIDSDFFFMESLEPEGVLNDIIALVTQRLPKKYKFDILNDIQVLAPMKKGIIGTENLNIAMQQAINRSNNSIFRGGKKFLVGDKVMQLRNDYKREVYNGDIGKIVNIDQEEQQVIVVIDDREVIYEVSDLDELTLAYAVSIHKYQGCECPCIVMPIHTTHFKLLHRNLLYTGVTRGKKLVILVGTKKALAIAVKNDEVKKRYSGLQQALVGFENISISLTK
jgi:exodeoxyribonuclease V alpha subunit